MVKSDVLRRRLEQLNISLRKLERYKDISFEEFAEDDVIQDVVEYNLFISINMMVDIAMHIVVDEKLGSTDNMREAFEILYKEKYIKKEDMINYKNMIAFRNILSHEYVKIDKKIVFSVLKNNLDDFRNFIVIVTESFKL
jgi:uncharacterized protein YutE (UPF0331/DUF86 family)